MVVSSYEAGCDYKDRKILYVKIIQINFKPKDNTNKQQVIKLNSYQQLTKQSNNNKL